MNNCMVDLETLGTHPGCVVLSIGAVMFDATGLDQQFYVEITQASSERHGLRADMSTVNWWMTQNIEAQGVLIRTAEKAGSSQYLMDLPDALKLFSAWLPSDAFVWGNGASFDNAILAQCYRHAGITPPWKFWNDRCYRTLKNLSPPGIPFDRIGIPHHALDDATSQAVHASAIMRRFGEALLGETNV